MTGATAKVWSVLPVLAAVVLLVAGIGKLLDFHSFRSAVANHGVVSSSIMRLIWLVPIVEILVAIGAIAALGIDASRRLPIAVLAAVYGGLCLYALNLHVHPPPKPAACGCGWSSGPVERWLDLVVQNGAVAGGMVATLLFGRDRRTLHGKAAELVRAQSPER